MMAEDRLCRNCDARIADDVEHISAFEEDGEAIHICPGCAPLGFVLEATEDPVAAAIREQTKVHQERNELIKAQADMLREGMALLMDGLGNLAMITSDDWDKVSMREVIAGLSTMSCEFRDGPEGEGTENTICAACGHANPPEQIRWCAVCGQGLWDDEEGPADV